MYRILTDVYYFSRMLKDKAFYIYSEYILNEETDIIDNVERLEVIETNEGFYNVFKNLFIEPTKIVDNIYLGNAYNASNFNQLDEFNITTIINVTNEIPNYFEELEKFSYLKIPIDDTNSNTLLSFFDKINEYIKNNEREKTKTNILIHCYMGSSRSATVIIAYLVKKYNFSLQQALELVKEKRPVVNINTKFWNDLETYFSNLD